jgi:hypothetical protein
MYLDETMLPEEFLSSDLMNSLTVNLGDVPAREFDDRGNAMAGSVGILESIHSGASRSRCSCSCNSEYDRIA